MKKTALLLIDIQNDYFPGGRNPLEGSPQAAAQAHRLLGAFRSASLPRLHVQHISTRPGATFFLPDTDGAQIHAEVQPAAGELVVQKHFPNSFRETPLLDCLRELEIERLVIGGMMTHMCIDATIRAAADLGFECWLAQDACATKALSFDDQTIPAGHVHAAFLAAIRSTYGQVITVDKILEQMQSL
jgi:nicotinamidase-related amidase